MGLLKWSKMFAHKLMVIASFFYSISTYKKFHRNTLLLNSLENLHLNVGWRINEQYVWVTYSPPTRNSDNKKCLLVVQIITFVILKWLHLKKRPSLVWTAFREYWESISSREGLQQLLELIMSYKSWKVLKTWVNKTAQVFEEY